jgi:hypothetical protein
MRARLLVIIAVAVALLSLACGPEPSDPIEGPWRGTITTEGDVTTVVTESGSVWGGSATLVEETSIGVAQGPDEYMFGRITSLAADARHIFVLETMPPVVRVYDLDGVHVRNIGSEGQGPGELTSPYSLVLMPDGNLMVRDDENARISFFSVAGELLEDWSLPGGFGTSRQSFVTPDGTLYSPQPVARDPESGRPIWGMVPYGPDGQPGAAIQNPDPPVVASLEFPTRTQTTTDGRRMRSGGGLVPFSPRAVIEYSPVGAVLVGASDQYRFEVRYFDGRVLVIERDVEPVPVSSEEAAWTRLYTTAVRRSGDPDWEWDGPEIPGHKGFFEYLAGDPDGRIWVSRYGPGIRRDLCDEDPEPNLPSGIARCWESRTIADVFGPDGRFLGDVEMPRGFGIYDLRRTFINDDMVLIVSEDDAGTIMVKRYRLVLPGEE